MNKTMTSKNGIRLLTAGKYCSENIEIVPDGQANIIPSNIKKDVTILGVLGTCTGIIEEISTDSGMNSVLSSENVGKGYKFTGTTGTYTNNRLYQVVLQSNKYKFTEYLYNNVLVDYLYFHTDVSNTIKFSVTGTLSTPPVLYYSKDKVTWNRYTLGSNVSLSAGENCYWRGNNNSFSTSTSNFIKFTSTSNIEVHGNIMTLLDSTGELLSLSGKNYVFYGLFYQSLITTAPRLPATTLSQYCYALMFEQCPNLTGCPDLPATTMQDYCYLRMFQLCQNLTDVPELPALTLAPYCYQSMFRYCTSLTIAQTVLPATIMQNYCYDQMYAFCDNLTKSPNILATTLAYRCFHWLFATTANPPGLKEIHISYTGPLLSDYFSQWVNTWGSTQNSGTFYYDGTDTTRGVSAIPEGWTIVGSHSTPYDITQSGDTLTASGFYNITQNDDEIVITNRSE